MDLSRYLVTALTIIAILLLTACGREAASTPPPTSALTAPAPTVAPTLASTPAPTPRPTPTPTPPPSSVKVIDDMGREVEIPYRPKRLAVTSAFMVELTMACGYRPIARPDIPPEFIYPLEAHDIPSFGVSHSAGPNLEQLAVAQPDLIISSPTYSQFIPSIEETLGVPVLVHDVASVGGIMEKIRTYGSLVGCEQKAELAVEDLERRIESLQQGLPKTVPNVLAIFGTSQSFLGLTANSYLGDMVGLLGGQLINEGDPTYVSSRTGEPNPKYTPFSMEKIVERNPDVILVVRHGSPSEAREEHFASLFDDPAWGGLKAVEEGRVHELSEWLFIRYPGPRVVLALEQLRSILYPEAR